MRNLCIYLFILLATTSSAWAQQDPFYSLYQFDKMLINPAFAGSSNYIVASIKNREQFIGLPNHPATKTFNVHAPLQKKHLGLGCKIISDRIGPLTTMVMAANISYHLNLAGGKLSLGLEAGSNTQRLALEQLTVNNKNDASLLNGSANSKSGDFNLGCYYQKKQFYIGYSAYHLLRKINTATSNVAQSVNYIIAGNVFQLPQKFQLDLVCLTNFGAKKIQSADINAVLMYNERFGIGAGLRSNTCSSFFLRIGITESLRLTYAHDTQPFSKTIKTGASHEVLLSYGLKLAPPPSKKEIHPRYYF